mgnify:CR=1 FL=1
MQKILIVINHMHVGGIQKSLLELLKVLSVDSRYDVSLFCCKKEGDFLNSIPSTINVLPENPYARMSELSAAKCKKEGMLLYFLRIAFSLWSKWFNKEIPSKILCRLIGRLGDEYDIAISFSQPLEDHAFCNLTNEITLQCVKARKKITFLHCDFGSYGGNSKRNRALYHKFDSIAAVSDSVGKRFKEIVPELDGLIHTVYNFCDCEEIKELANENPVEYDKACIVTVARLSEEKGLLRCVPVFAKLKEENIPFEWHIVGGGSLKDRLENLINESNLGDCIFLEGEQLNPYRYIKNANYLLLPSYHEAAPMVFDEARSLNVPILSTNTLSAKELVENRNVGFVCENTDDDIYNMLKYALALNDARFDLNQPDQEVCKKQFEQLCELI